MRDFSRNIIRAIIVDDERMGRLVIRSMIDRFCRSVQVVGEASSAADGAAIIADQKPELVFLDIGMPGGSGFDFLDGFPNRDFDVIFVTAHEHLARKAMKYDPLDYLLKPIDIAELQAAVNKAPVYRKPSGLGEEDLTVREPGDHPAS